MKKLISNSFLLVLFVSMVSCGGGISKKEMLNDVNELCKAGIQVRKGENLQEASKMQKEIREKYKANNDQLIELDDKVKACVEENFKE